MSPVPGRVPKAIGKGVPKCPSMMFLRIGCSRRLIPSGLEGPHSFLPIRATVQVSAGSSMITLRSPADYDLDILVRIGNRALLVVLVPNCSGSFGTLAVPEILSLPAAISLQACLREGDEQ